MYANVARDRMSAVEFQGTEPDLGSLVGTQFERAAMFSKPALVVFSELRSESDVRGLIDRLSGPAWAVTRTPDAARPAMTRVRVQWRNPASAWVDTMGFAPFGTMPTTRRAPVVALGVWPGGKENAMSPTHSRKRISLADSKLWDASMDQATHDRFWSEGEDDTEQLLALDGDAATDWYKLSFRLAQQGLGRK